MLKLKTKTNHTIKNLFTPQKQLEFSPVRVSGDELIEDIEHEDESAERNWRLEKYPDVGGLATFWSGVQEDLESDPEWINFGSD